MQTGIPWRSAGLAVLAGLVLSAYAPAASAHGATPSLEGAPTPASPPGDGAAAQSLVADVESRAKDPDLAKIVAPALGKAKLSLERARGARVSGDDAHARLLDGLALEFAETARDLLRAATAEAAAAVVGQKTYVAATQVERARTLLEETQARRGRAAAELERALAEGKASSKGAAEAEQHRLESKTNPPAPSHRKKPKADEAKPREKKVPR